MRGYDCQISLKKLLQLLDAYPRPNSNVGLGFPFHWGFRWFIKNLSILRPSEMKIKTVGKSSGLNIRHREYKTTYAFACFSWFSLVSFLSSWGTLWSPTGHLSTMWMYRSSLTNFLQCGAICLQAVTIRYLQEALDSLDHLLVLELPGRPAEETHKRETVRVRSFDQSDFENDWLKTSIHGEGIN